MIHKITCKICGTEWNNLTEYMKRPPCLNSNCKLTEKRMDKTEPPRQVKMRVIVAEKYVLSYCDLDKPHNFVTSPFVICGNIYPHGGGK